MPVRYLFSPMVGRRLDAYIIHTFWIYAAVHYDAFAAALVREICTPVERPRAVMCGLDGKQLKFPYGEWE